MSRTTNPITKYIVRSQINNGYRYAYVQRLVEVEVEKDVGGEIKKEKEFKRRKLQLGKLTNDGVFIPNDTFRLLEIDDRRQLIFPKEWDITAANNLDGGKLELSSGEGEAASSSGTSADEKIRESSNNSESDGQIHEVGNTTKKMNNENSIDKLFSISHEVADTLFYSCTLYGSCWMLEQIAIQKGVIDDLQKTFDNDLGTVQDVMTMAIYTVVENRSFNRLDRWLNLHKTMSNRRFGSDYVTRFSQTITDNHRMTFIGLRVGRQPKGAKSSIDSTTRSGYGYLVNLRYGNNKDRDDLPCTLEVYVYSLTTHEPIYYRRMPGNTSDLVTIRTIIADLKNLNIPQKALLFMTDRGYCSRENMALLHKSGSPFLMCAKVGQVPVMDCLLQIKYDAVGLPINMEYDPSTKLYYCQMDAEAFTAVIEDGEEYVVSGVKVNLFMNPDNRLAACTRIRRAVQEEKKLVAQYETGEITLPAIEKLRSKLKYHSVTHDKETKKTTFSFKDEIEKKAYAQCGFFASCMYKHDLNGIESFHEYKFRDEHEKNFFGLKEDENADMQDCSSEESADGRAFIYFVGLILLDTLKYGWKEKLKPRIKSSRDVLDIMEPIRYSRYINGNTHMTTFNAEQISVCNALGINPPPECMTSTAKEEWRRKHEPKKRGRKPRAENKVDN